MVLLLLGVVRNDLLQSWQRSLPTDSPNQFLINIDPAQIEGIEALFVDELGRAPFSLPLIRGRITRIKGVPADDYEFPKARGAAIVQREANLTWSPDLPESNLVVAGQWFV